MDAALESWVNDQVHVMEITAVRQRPWSTVWRVESAEGRWWLKVNSAGTSHESTILALLRRTDSPLTPVSITHADQPWALVADAGVSARELLKGADASDVLGYWCDLLPRYAALQRSLPAHELTTAGVPDFSPSLLVQQFDELSGDRRWFEAPAAPGWSASDQERLISARSALAAVADELARGLSPTLQHDDLHDGNVFSGSGGTRIIDWGDAMVAHPFSTLRVTLDVQAAQLGVAPDSPALRRVSDAYLEPWLAGGESREQLRRQLDLALAVAGLGRAAGWARALGSPTTGLELGYADAVAVWMTRLANDLLAATSSR